MPRFRFEDITGSGSEEIYDIHSRVAGPETKDDYREGAAAFTGRR